MEYRRINQKLVRKLYALLIIGETMQQLEDFQYVTALDLNMGYYNIRFLPASQYITTIVTEFDKFRYHRLPMGMCALGHILQAKVDDIPGDIKGVKTYIDCILVFIK